MSKNARHISSKQLINQFRNGDKNALRKLIQKFHPKMIRSIQYYTKAREAAEDIAQECWYTILEKLGQVDLRISFEAWAFTIAKRKSIDWIRNQQRSRNRDNQFESEYASQTDSESGISENEKTEKIHLGIQQLQPTQKIVLTMFYLENLSLQEISDILNISTGTVKSRLFYARENLKKIISL